MALSGSNILIKLELEFFLNYILKLKLYSLHFTSFTSFKKCCSICNNNFSLILIARLVNSSKRRMEYWCIDHLMHWPFDALTSFNTCVTAFTFLHRFFIVLFQDGGAEAEGFMMGRQKDGASNLQQLLMKTNCTSIIYHRCQLLKSNLRIK